MYKAVSYLYQATLLTVTLAPGAAFAASPGKAKSYLVYLGTYTTGSSKGIYAYRFSPSTGDLAPLGLVAETPSPSYLAADRKGNFLYAVNEVDNFEGKKAGSVSAFRLDRVSGKLTFLNTVSTRGDGPCHLMVDKTGKTLLVANYGGGSVAAFPIGADGRLGAAAGFDQHAGTGANPERQTGPHAHCANISPNNKFAMVADLGLDKVFVYKLDPAKAALTPNDPPFASVAAGAGPRHFDFHPNGRHAYAINELQSTVTAFDYDGKRGALKEIQTVSTLPPDFKGSSSTAEIFVHPSGRFLYGSNRGHDSIAVFSIDAEGKLKLLEDVSTLGQVPRGFAIDPTGRYLVAANQKTDNVVVYKIDGSTGRLSPTGKTVSLGSPVSVMFVAGK